MNEAYIHTCKTCSSRNRVPRDRKISRAFCSKCGGLLFTEPRPSSERVSSHGDTITDKEKQNEFKRRAQRDFRLGHNIKERLIFCRSIPLSASFIALLGVSVASGFTLWSNIYSGLSTLIFIMSGSIVMVCVHEYGHALVAYFGGDSSVRTKGYLTLNVLSYAHPVYSIAMPLMFLLMGGIPLPGGAVYINTKALRSKFWISMVSAAGIFFTAIFLVPVILVNNYASVGPTAFWEVLSYIIYIQIAAMLFNLVPIPGLDGFGILEPFLPTSFVQLVEENRGIFQILPFLIFLYPNPVLDTLWLVASRLCEHLHVFPGELSLSRILWSVQ